jgi:hypothetical protein
MTYNFNDVAAPSLPTFIPAGSDAVELVDGSPQGDLLSSSYSGTSVFVTIAPPSGWTVTAVSWSNGSSGTLVVPAPGIEVTYTFNYTISQTGQASKSNGGVFKIKKAGGS